MLTALLWITLAASIILLIAVAAPIRLSCKATYRENGRDAEFDAVAYYLHPRALRVEYSAADGDAKVFILGRKRGRKDRQGEEGINTAGINTDTSTGINNDTSTGINNDTSGGIDNDTSGGIDIDTSTSINNDTPAGIDIDTSKGINGDKSAGINTDTSKGINGDTSAGINTDTSTGINNDTVDTDGINTDSINKDGTDTGGINTNNKNSGANGEKRSIPARIRAFINSIKRRRLYKIVADKPLRGKLLRWLRRSSARVMRVVSFEKLTLRARVGMRDPAALGRLYGYFSAARAALALRGGRADISMEPVFMENRLDVDSELAVKTTLSAVLWQLLAIAATFPYLRLRKVIRRR